MTPTATLLFLFPYREVHPCFHPIKNSLFLISHRHSWLSCPIRASSSLRSSPDNTSISEDGSFSRSEPSYPSCSSCRNGCILPRHRPNEHRSRNPDPHDDTTMCRGSDISWCLRRALRGHVHSRRPRLRCDIPSLDCSEHCNLRIRNDKRLVVEHLTREGGIRTS